MNALGQSEGFARLGEVVSSTAPKPGHGPLISALGERLSDVPLKLVYSRKGWHLPGGVVDAHGNRVSDSLSDWLYSESNGDVMDLCLRYEDAGLLATRLCGTTHYLTAKTGDAPWQFIQVEVDELREITDHELFDPENIPDDVQELLDPVDAVKVDPTPLGPGFYRLRQARDMADAHAQMVDASAADSLLALRFFDEWQASSAAKRAFSSAFVLRMTDYKDRFGDKRLQATPLATHAQTLPPLPQSTERGVELSHFLGAFDRAVGYPMAWYFHLASGALPQLESVAHAVFEDVSGVYDYLPERDVAVLQSWIDNPYMF